MNLQAFKSSTDDDQSPQGISPALEALWHQAKGDWDAAHRLAQSQNNPAGKWVHAYLHRIEGDNDNAEYWYNLAGKEFCSLRLADEWEEIVESLLLAG